MSSVKVTSAKINFEGECRRIPLRETFHHLIEDIKAAFSLDNTPQVKYLDDENDYITISSNLEFNEALNFQKSGVIKLTIVDTHGFQIVKSHLGELTSFDKSTLKPLKLSSLQRIKEGLVKKRRLVSELRDVKRSLKQTTPVVRSVSDIIGTNVVFSERQGKTITIQEPRKRERVKSQRPAYVQQLALARRCGVKYLATLRPTTTKVRSISDIIGTSVVFSERQGKTIMIQEPKGALTRNPTKPSKRALKRNYIRPSDIHDVRRALKPAKTCLKTLTQHLGTDTVFSERQGKIIKIQEPRSTCKCYAANHLDLQAARSALKPTKTRVRTLTQYLGTDTIFSQRQGKIIKIQEPLRSHKCAHMRKSTQHLDMVFSEHQGKVQPLDSMAERLTKTLFPNEVDNELMVAASAATAAYLSLLSQIINSSNNTTANPDPATALLHKHNGNFRAACSELMGLAK